MSEPITISPAPHLNPGLDYFVLQAEGIALVQQLSGELWTDYNESDPGVTILEQLCYALTELSYRAEIPLADLLVPHPDGHIHPRRQALYIPKRIFPCNPVTIDDYRKLIVDRVPQVANVWLTPRRFREDTDGVDGLYAIDLYCPGIVPPCAPPEEEKAILDAVRRVYCRHRGLCEDVEAIRILCPLPTIVRAGVSIAEGRRPEAILAGILFNLGEFLAPELRRQPLSELMAAGMAPSAIFNGPLLLNGFIADGELQPKAAEIRVQDVARVIAQSPGVLGVRNVAVEVVVAGESFASGPGGRSCGGPAPIPIPPRCLPRLDIRPEGRFTIRLFRGGLEIQPDPARVERELAKLWAEARRTYRLAAQYEEYFAFPQGRYRDVERYTSIQNQFPDVYGINEFGVESEALPPRQAQAKQLKGYLLVFEQLLADFFAQLAHVRDLYSADPGARHTYFFQSLAKSVPNVEPLLAPDYLPGLHRIVQGEDRAVERRNRFLDLLLALYGESLDASSVWDLTDSNDDDRDTGRRLLHAKLALLHRLVAATHNRGRGMDYLERSTRGNIAGLEIKSRIQLGLHTIDHRPLIDLLDELAVDLVAAGEGSLGRPLPRHAELIDEQFAPVPTEGDAEEDSRAAPPEPPRGLAVPEDLLRAGGGELRVGRLPGDSAFALVWRGGSGAAEPANWRLLGKHPDRESAAAAGRAFLALLCALRRHGQQLYVVEHTLLRFASVPDFPYSFTITAVLSPPRGRRRDDDYRLFAREVLRQNTPAHVVVDTLFLGPCRMQRFERLYWDWRRALRLGKEPLLRETSADLIRFFDDCRGEEAAS